MHGRRDWDENLNHIRHDYDNVREYSKELVEEIRQLRGKEAQLREEQPLALRRHSTTKGASKSSSLIRFQDSCFPQLPVSSP